MQNFDLVIAGTGFSATFFLHRWLRQMPDTARVLVLEHGSVDPHRWQRENRRNSRIDETTLFDAPNREKRWGFTVGFGGGSNCWWGCAPRFLPADFALHSRYGVGMDWPLSYQDLEPYYCEVEALMQISGPADGGPSPRSVPYPQPPHRFTEPDRLLKAAYPDQFFQQPCARARVATENRPACCAGGNCRICPVNAKFTIQNDMASVYADARVTLQTNARVICVDMQGSVAKGLVFENGAGRQQTARGDTVVLATNALFNAAILMNSGDTHPVLGRYLHEQVSVDVTVDLAGVDNFQGSTSITGHAHNFHDHAERGRWAGGIVETWNIPNLRSEVGRWRQRLFCKFIFEDHPQATHHLTLDPERTLHPRIHHAGHSVQCERALKKVSDLAAEFFRPLPVENLRVGTRPNRTENHLLGTTRFGRDPATSVLDPGLVHHRYRNLLVLGSGAFPAGGPAAPTLTLSALSSYAADKWLR